jgi:hypothetical protein
MDNKKMAIIGAGVVAAGLALYYIFKSNNKVEDKLDKLDEFKDEEEEKAIRHIPGIQKMPSNKKPADNNQIQLDKDKFTKELYIEILKKGTLEHNT